MPKKMSLKQVEANRRNAQRSTGPNTDHGKAVSKLNALKHGILSKEVLVRGSVRKESSRELSALHQRFRQQLAPVGPVEEMLVDQIVTAHWRLRRALTAESGAIALSVDEGQRKRRRAPHPQLQWAAWEARGDPLLSMEDSSLGNRLIEGWLKEVRAAVEREGELTETAINLLRVRGKANYLTRELEALREKWRANPEGLEPAAWQERKKQQALAYLDGQLNHVAWRTSHWAEWDAREEEARRAAAVLPSAETLDRILRYETKLERQMYRAMAQLERLQRMRQGEAVPAPLSVELSDRT